MDGPVKGFPFIQILAVRRCFFVFQNIVTVGLLALAMSPFAFLAWATVKAGLNIRLGAPKPTFTLHSVQSFSNVTDRADVQALIPEDVANEIIKNAEEQSATLKMFRRVTMSNNQQRMPVLSTLPTAYFVTGDTGLKQTTEMSWTNKYLNVEEIAVIIPVPENVVDDVSFDLWGEIKPKIVEAIGRTLDAAVFFGVNKPESWPAGIVASAIAAGNDFERGTSTSEQGGIAQDINEAMGLIEDDGFDVTGFVTSRSYRKRLRGARDTQGQKLLDVALNTIEGEPVVYALRGLWPDTGSQDAEFLALDVSQFVCAVRKDITWKMLDQAVIQNAAGQIIFNLAQQDMVAMRVTFRVAWQVANPITHERPGANNAQRYPASVLRSPID